jgi:hypothetical protein
MVWGRARTRQPGRTIRDVEVLVHIGTRSTAGIGTLTVGFALGLLVTYGLADAGWRAVPAHPSDFETSYPRSPDLQQPLRPQMPISPGMRLASLEIPVASDFGVQDTERPAFAERRASFGDRFLLDEHLDSFDERFGGVSTGTETEGLADTALRPSSDLSDSPICNPPIRAETGRFIAACQRREETDSHGRSFTGCEFAPACRQPHRDL